MNTHVTVKLEKCPFCGGQGHIAEAPSNKQIGVPCFAVYCDKCNVMMGRVDNGITEFYRTPIDAVLAWNRRAK